MQAVTSSHHPEPLICDHIFLHLLSKSAVQSPEVLQLTQKFVKKCCDHPIFWTEKEVVPLEMRSSQGMSWTLPQVERSNEAAWIKRRSNFSTTHKRFLSNSAESAVVNFVQTATSSHQPEPHTEDHLHF